MNDADDDTEDTEDITFDHLQRPDGSRFLRIHTGTTNYLVQVERDDLDRLKERIDEPPTVL